MSADPGALPRSSGSEGPGLAVITVSALLAVAFLYVVLIGGGYPASSYLAPRVAIQAIAFAVIGGWILAILVRPDWWPRSPLGIPVALVIGAMTLSTVLSVEPWMATGGLAFAAVAGGVFLLVARLAQVAPFARRIATLLVLLPVIVVVAYAVQASSPAWRRGSSSGHWSAAGRSRRSDRTGPASPWARPT